MEEKLYPRRWAILVGMSILLLATNFAFVLPGGAAVLVMIEYQCEPMQFSMIMSIPYLAGVLFCFAGGSLSDRLGMGRVFAVSFIITIIACIVRIFVHGYWVLFAVMFFMGAGNAVLNANSAKLLRLWFPGPSNSFAMGVYVAMLSLGAAIALVFGSHIDDIYFGWKVSAAFMAVGVAAWFIAYRDHPDGEAQSEASIFEFLGDVLKNRYVWGISIFAFLWFGTTTLNSQYMTAALTALIGDPSLTGEAGNLSSINTLLTCIGSIVMPLVWAKFFKKMRVPMLFVMVAPAIILATVYFLPYGATTWVLYLIVAVFMSAGFAFVKLLPVLLPGIKPEEYGAVGGVQATFQNLGMFLFAPYIASPLAIVATGVPDGLLYYRGVYVITGITLLIAFLAMFLFPNVATSIANKEE